MHGRLRGDSLWVNATPEWTKMSICGRNTCVRDLVQVAITSGQGPYVEIVRKAQLGTKLRKVRCVDAKGLPLLPDNLHLTTTAQVRLGRMLANAFLELQATQ
ncbi:hypothetical protein LXL04_008073 [Taraxacum kok-saghyz]